MVVKAFMDGKEEIERLQERITGTFLSVKTICDKDGNVIVKANHMITPKRAELVWQRVLMRTVSQSQRLRSVQCLPVVHTWVYVLSVTVQTLQQVRQYRLVKQSVSSQHSQSVSLVHSLP